MTFEEALKAKEEIGETTMVDDVKCKVFVVPYNNQDFDRYKSDYIRKPFTDESAKLYSTDSRFKVYGIWQYMANLGLKELRS